VAHACLYADDVCRVRLGVFVKECFRGCARNCDKYGHKVFVDIERMVGFTPRNQYEARQKEKTGK
jgi:hypothetical protein